MAFSINAVLSLESPLKRSGWILVFQQPLGHHKNHHAEAVNREKNVKVLVRTHCSLIRVGVHHPSCFLAGLMGTGLLWAEQTLSRQETSSSSCFMHACRLIPASFLVAYQLQQHYFLPESPMTAATNRFPSDTLSCTFVLISTCFVVSSYP